MALKLAQQSRAQVVQYPIHRDPRFLPIKDRCHPPMHHIWSKNRPVTVGYPVGIHILIDSYAVCVICINAWPNQSAGPLARCGTRRAARRVTTMRGAKGNEIPEPSSY